MNDLVQTIDCLTEDELDFVLNYIESEVEWEQTTVFQNGGDTGESEVRTGTRFCMEDSHAVTEVMHQAMNRALLTYAREIGYVNEAYVNAYPTPGAYNTNSYREGIQLLKYEEGQFYRKHVDTAPWRETPEHHRTFSIVLYLNDAFEGGRTIFPHRAFKPRAGQALIFPSNWCYPHECEVVMSGTKLAAVTWYYAIYEG